MSKLEKKIKADLRGPAQSNGYYKIIKTFGELRKATPPEKYDYLINQLKLIAPTKARHLISTGRKEFNELLWSSNLQALSLSREITFSTRWLSGHSDEINKFLIFSEELERLIISREHETALKKLLNFISEKGWSLWATELYFYLTCSTNEFEEFKKTAESLAKGSGNRVSGLVSLFLLDRNDHNYSVDAFFSKWKETFANLKVPEPLRNYLTYRAATQLDDLEQGMADCLSFDVVNSLFDCYTTLVDICATCVIEEVSSSAKSSAIQAVKDLIKAGVHDYRLEKILFLNGDFSVIRDSRATPEQSILHNQLHHIRGHNKLTNGTLFWPEIEDISINGATAEKSINTILHFGLNTKSLDIGNLLINFAFKNAEEDLICKRTTQWIISRQRNYFIEDIISFDADNAIAYLGILKENSSDSETRTAIDKILGVTQHGTSWEPSPYVSAPVTLWIGVNLIQRERHNDVEHIIQHLDEIDEHWSRQSKKLSILKFSKMDDLPRAVDISNTEILKDQRNSLGLPLNLIFEGRKWNDLKHIDPVSLAISSHSYYNSSSIPAVQYICRMACRAISKIPSIINFDETWSTLDRIRQQEVRYFFKFIWIEENLSLTDISTSQQARQTRLHALQKLFTIDTEENQKEYAEEIKSLTLHETLWLGLKQINESRIFVNEPAISRWAEKELAHDFERWKSTDGSDAKADILNEILLSYLLENDAQQFKKSLYTENLSERETLVISIVERLLRRFLLDPTDGLNPYLSSRIRHGSLKGTILGPLEEGGLLISTSNTEEIDFGYMGNWPSGPKQSAAKHIYALSKSVNELIEFCNKDVLRIQTSESPGGKISVILDKTIAPRIYSEAAKVCNLPSFISFCFETFWGGLRHSLNNISNYISIDFKAKIQAEFDSTIEKVRAINHDTIPLLTALHSIATSTQLQCDEVASWFRPEKELEQKTFTLDEIAEISKRATKNVYRLFDAKITTHTEDTSGLQLTTYGLTTISDCLYIILENCWKHSGLRSDEYEIFVNFIFIRNSNTLNITVKSPLSEEKLEELRSWKLLDIQKRYENDANYELASSEGGSGIPKLARLVRHIDRSLYAKPIDIRLDESDNFVVDIYMPLFKRGDAYDAYSQ